MQVLYPILHPWWYLTPNVICKKPTIYESKVPLTKHDPSLKEGQGSCFKLSLPENGTPHGFRSSAAVTDRNALEKGEEDCSYIKESNGCAIKQGCVDQERTHHPAQIGGP